MKNELRRENILKNVVLRIIMDKRDYKYALQNYMTPKLLHKLKIRFFKVNETENGKMYPIDFKYERIMKAFDRIQ